MRNHAIRLAAVVLACAMFVGVAVPQTAAGDTPTTGEQVVWLGADGATGLHIYSRALNTVNLWAGIYLVQVVDGEGNPVGPTYGTYCLELYQEILANTDELIVDEGLENFLTAEDACVVNYIMNMYQPTSDVEAASIQAAIWYFLTAEFGVWSPGDFYYQYMTDPFGEFENYDARNYDPAIPVEERDDVRVRALEIVAEVEALEACTYPVSIELTPDAQSLAVGVEATVVAKVLDQNGDAFEGAEVAFEVVSGDGVINPSSGVTDSNGEVLVAVTGTGTVVIKAYTNGGEGVLLYDSLTSGPVDEGIQNLAVIPDEVCDDAQITWSECHFPAGHTKGWWKNNIGKNLRLMGETDRSLPNGRPQLTAAQLESYLEAIDENFDDSGDCLDWLKVFDGNTRSDLRKAYDILNYKGSSADLKAQAQILSLLLTDQWYEQTVEDEGFYTGGCVRLSDGSTMSIGGAIDEILDDYCAGNFLAAAGFADWINNQPEDGY